MESSADRDALFGAASASRRSPRGAVASNDTAPGLRQRGGSDRHFVEPSLTAMGGYGNGSRSIASNNQDRPAQHPLLQQGPLSWAEVRANIDIEERRRGLQSAYESVEVGREALERLDDQQEKLERSEMVLDSTRYAIERSARILRGMTFWGKIRNAFSDDPRIPQQANRPQEGDSTAEPGGEARTGSARNNPRETGSAAAVARSHHRNNGDGNTEDRDDTPMEGFICPDCRKLFFSADALVAHFESAHQDGTAAAATAAPAVDDDDGGGGGGGARPRASLRSGFEASVREGEKLSVGVSHSSGKVGDASSVHSHFRDQLFGVRDGGARVDSVGPVRGGGGEGGGGVIAEQKAMMASQDAYLDSVGQVVKELGLLGRNIGASLDGQAETLSRVADKSAETNDHTAFVTRKAARQAQRARPKQPTFVMSVAFQEISTGLFLAVTGEDIVLQGRELRNVCRFEAWERQHGIIGLKSSVTRRWVGQTFLGYLRVSGTSFGKNYEWQGDLTRKETMMVCCSANWGAGGYLSVRPNSITSGVGGGGVDNSGPASPTATMDSAELALVDATITNKPRAAVFRVVNCEGYTPQPFVGGKLMRNPGPAANNKSF